MSRPVKVGDKVVLEARVRRVDAETFTIRIGEYGADHLAARPPCYRVGVGRHDAGKATAAAAQED